MPCRHRRFAPIGRFAARTRGSATIEFVLWLPLFGVLMAMIADFSILFMTQASMWDTARDAARRIAISQMTAEEAEDFVAASLHGTARDLTVIATDGAEVVVQVTAPIRASTPFGFYGHVAPGDLIARVVMLKEPI